MNFAAFSNKLPLSSHRRIGVFLPQLRSRGLALSVRGALNRSPASKGFLGPSAWKCLELWAGGGAWRATWTSAGSAPAPEGWAGRAPSRGRGPEPARHALRSGRHPQVATGHPGTRDHGEAAGANLAWGRPRPNRGEVSGA